MVADQDWSRRYINAQVNRLRRMFKWGVGRELVKETIWSALRAVEPLTEGKTKARETDPITIVDDIYVEAVLPFLNRHVRAMVLLQSATGMRPGEVCIMRWIDIDTSNPLLWEYRPLHHKNTHRGQDRVVYLNTEAQAIIEPFRRPDIAGYIFSPAVAEEERRAAKTAARKTPLSSGNRPGTNRARKPRKAPGECYDTDSYRRAVTKACERADRWGKGGWIINSDERLIPHWHPHQIRHNTATRLRAEHGLEAAQVILGHKTLTATQIYAEKNVAKAKKIMQGGK
jgi:integrase